MLKAKNRLKKRTEFAYSYKKGQTSFNLNFGLVIFKRKDKLLRIGFSVSKKIGKAVIRNKVKRRLRAVIRENIGNIKEGYNLIIIAKENIINLTYTELTENLLKFLAKKELLK